MSENYKPWKVISEKEIYDNSWIAVTEFDVINPNGGKGIYGKVHFKNIAIGIIVLDGQHNTYLVGQHRFPLDQYSWEIPEGGGALDVDPLVSAQRELLEETGITAKNWQIIQKMHLSNSVSDELGLIFLATELKYGEAMPEETEDLSVKKVKFGEAYKMVCDGLITDSMSVAGILKLKLMMLENSIQDV